MSYNLDLLPIENVLISRWNEDFKINDEIYAYDNDLWRTLEEITEPLYLIMEFQNPVLSIKEIMMCIKQFTEGKSTFNHPMVKQLIIVTDKSLYRMAARGMNTPRFGNVEAKIFKTVDEALADIRAKVA